LHGARNVSSTRYQHYSQASDLGRGGKKNVLTNIIGECRKLERRRGQDDTNAAKSVKKLRTVPSLAAKLCPTRSMHASLVRRQLSGLVPPKIASPSILVSLPRFGLPSFFFTCPFLPSIISSVGREGCGPQPPRRFLLQAPQGPCAYVCWRWNQGALLQREERLGITHRLHHVGHFRTWVHHRLPECVAPPLSINSHAY
jgi:hypothetical protein